ncbi:hypothetical protein KV100_07535 [Mumia sp. zg.B21]|uniref:hypothetical protein n=1 Tax=Mumia sp. zg.B21 TaxID=2855447 RepID=UPI001C6EEFBD|nr:hypothetical protein [Mumia sp. zg.B21]MBW9209504.1 hypothetical protein [Mumia sp. zg.B21]
MHHHNHYYGQTHVLARYCGLNDTQPPRLRGYLQHGWNISCGWNPVHEFFDGAWRYVWSDAPRRRGHSLGRRNYHVIGAPWLYLLENEPEPVPPPAREGTLWFLFHGWEGGKITGDHQRLIDEIRETEPGPVTFSLYYTEYERPEVRRTYEDAGFDVVSFGKRGWNYQGTDRRFLHKQLHALRRHERVASNRLSTAIFYGISAGCQPAVYGDPMELAGENPLFGGTARIARLWGDLLGKDVDMTTAREITDLELGRPWLMPPEELRLILDWENHD